MADEEHLKILLQGVKAWNRWRDENPGIRPDLTEAPLLEEDLSGADLSRADLSGAYLTEVCLDDADLSGANLLRANLREADLSGANLRQRIYPIWTASKQSLPYLASLRLVYTLHLAVFSCLNRVNWAEWHPPLALIARFQKLKI
jgi:uncharacterized protein YjbI with pentapeptide repeats